MAATRGNPGAVLNANDDSAGKRNRDDAIHRALLNILEDAAEETRKHGDTQRAIMNLLNDAEGEKTRLEGTQTAILNILDDAAEEKAHLADLQRAALNILDDFNLERAKAERANAELRREIAERVRAEEALRLANIATQTANRDLESFSYSVAHDLRAPLRSIDGFSQALLEDCADTLSPDGVTFLGHVRESALHMSRLIDDLLMLSRLGRAEIVRSPIDLADIARTVFARLERDNPERSVESIVPAHLPAVGDARLMEVVFDNLLGNAWKFTNRRAKAHIEIGQMPTGPSTVWFVRDDGAGFDMAYAGKLFAVFQRLHAVSEFDGTGIGLANVERIIHRHGGRIWAESEVGRGATFYFTLEADR
jgi:light-regulated signal transduction histidine kinase (bacteriophytochrome)